MIKIEEVLAQVLENQIHIMRTTGDISFDSTTKKQIDETLDIIEEIEKPE